MKPIINPLWFYLINLFNNLSVIFIIIIGISAILGIVLAVIIIYEEVDTGFCSKDEKQKWYKYCKKSITIGIIIGAMFCITPTETTCYKMMAAQIVTPNNISTIGKTSEDIINYIVESVKEITDSNEDSESAKKN